MLQIVERKINMKTIKVKKHEVEKVISLLKKHEGSFFGVAHYTNSLKSSIELTISSCYGL